METGKHKKHKIRKVSRTKKKIRRAVYQAEYKAERRQFRNFMQVHDQKYNVSKISKRMVKANQDIIGDQCTRNDDGVLTVNNEDKKITWRSYHGKLLHGTGTICLRQIQCS